jgi:hypothetical protein
MVLTRASGESLAQAWEPTLPMPRPRKGKEGMMSSILKLS